MEEHSLVEVEDSLVEAGDSLVAEVEAAGTVEELSSRPTLFHSVFFNVSNSLTRCFDERDRKFLIKHRPESG